MNSLNSTASGIGYEHCKKYTTNAAKATQQMQMNIINSFASNINYKLFKIEQLMLLRQLWLCKGTF
jgi:hypothetical protein